MGVFLFCKRCVIKINNFIVMKRIAFRGLIRIVFLLGISNSYSNLKMNQLVFQNLEELNDENDNVIPFNEVEFPPFFYTCKRISEDCEKRNCVESVILSSLKEDLRDVFEKDKRYISRFVKSQISFQIRTDGVVDSVKVKSENDFLENAIKNSILKLPRLNPGMNNGSIVTVLYELKVLIGNKPIKQEQFKKTFFEVALDFEEEGASFDAIEKWPVFSGCKERDGSEKLKNCLSEKVTKFINKNFNMNVVRKTGVSGFNRIYVRFEISKCGNVINVDARGPHPALEEEAIRVVETLPKIKPGMRNGREVGVLYSLPIVVMAK